MESIETPAYIVNKSNLETSITSFTSAQKHTSKIAFLVIHLKQTHYLIF